MANKLIQLKDGNDNVFPQTDVNVSPTVVYKKTISGGASDTFTYPMGAYLIVGNGATGGGKYFSLLIGYVNGMNERTINTKLIEYSGLNVTISESTNVITIQNNIPNEMSVVIIRLI